MSEKILSTRIIHKHDVEANWLKATGFTPKQGELIVYDIDANYTYERIKVGDGISNVNDLPFVDDALKAFIETQLTELGSEIDAVSDLVGDAAVSEQIADAVSTKVDKAGDVMTGALRTMGLLSNAIDGINDGQVIILPTVPYALIDETHTVQTYLEKLLIWICENYPSCIYTTFIGIGSPSNKGSLMIHIYDTNIVDAETKLPSFASGIYIPATSVSSLYVFGTYQYAYSYKTVCMSDHTHKYAGSSAVGGAANSAVKAAQDYDGNVITDTYATKTELGNVSDLVGDTSVAEQIEAAAEVYVGPTQPTDPNIKVWINTSEEGTGVVPILPRITNITLNTSAWTGSSSPYSQVVDVNTITTSTKVDLQLTAAQITQLQNDDIMLMAQNDGTSGKATIYALGGKPSSNMTIQVLLTEVSFV